MKYALVNDHRQEPQPGLSGFCQGCGEPTIAKCGKIKIWHWAHRADSNCPLRKDETPWHRAWKEQFPTEWQERIHFDPSGEKHIADVKTNRDWALEFQHSPIKDEERKSRNEFYKKLVWVVDGTRRQRDAKQFFSSLTLHKIVGPTAMVRRVFKVVASDGALLREWGGSPAPVFFDFGLGIKLEESMLWCLLPNFQGEGQYVLEFQRSAFIALHRGDSTEKDHFLWFLTSLATTILESVSRVRPRMGYQVVRPGFGRSRPRF